MRAYHDLGNALAHLEAIERGEEEKRGDGDAGSTVTTPLTDAEYLACQRGACLRAMQATVLNLQAVREFAPRQGDDLCIEVALVRVKKGDE